MPACLSIWLTKTNDFELDSSLAKTFMSWLSTDEHEKYIQYNLPSQKVRFLLSRALLRRKLSHALTTNPQDLTFTLSERGKPYLTAPHDKLNFNLSHSGDWIGLCISDGETVGIDVEHPQKTRNIVAIANSYFHAKEINALNLLKEGPQIDYFHTLWTLKESFLKARGTGITEGLNKINFSIEGNKVSSWIDPSLAETANDWGFYTWQNPIPAEANDNIVYMSLAVRNPQKLQPSLNYTTPNGLLL